MTTEGAYIKLNTAFTNEIMVLVNLIKKPFPKLGKTLQRENNKIATIIGSVPAQGKPFAGKPPNENLVEITKWLKFNTPVFLKRVENIRREMRKFENAMFELKSVWIEEFSARERVEKMMKALNGVTSALLKTYKCYMNFYKGWIFVMCSICIK